MCVFSFVFLGGWGYRCHLRGGEGLYWSRGNIRIFCGIESNLSSSLSISKGFFPLSLIGLSLWDIFPRESFFYSYGWGGVDKLFKIFLFGGGDFSPSGFGRGCFLGRRLGILRGRL